MENFFEPKNKNNWCFIALDYNKRKQEAQQISNNIIKFWNENK